MNAPASMATASRTLADLPLSKVVLASGVELHYAKAGTGPRLIFIHGAMGDWRSFEPQWDAFVAAGFECVTYSRRYSFPNRNDMPSPDHGALQEAQDLAGLLDTLGWEDAILVGSSYGGFTALAFALEHPARVRALVSVEAPMMRYAQLTESGRQAAKEFREQTIEPANAAFRRGEDELASRIMTGGINGAQSTTAQPAAMARRLQNIRAMKMLAMSTDEFPWLPPERLAALSMPVLMLSGEKTAPVHAAIFANVVAAMPQAEKGWIEGAGHGCSRDNPQAFNARVIEFLARRLGL